MRVCEGKGCLQTMPSRSILEQTKFGQWKINRPLRPSGTSPNLGEEWSDGSGNKKDTRDLERCILNFEFVG